MSLAIVQAKQSASGADPATVTFAGAPTAGNLVINVFYNNSSSANTDQNGWTLKSKLVTGSGTQTIYVHYRYVVGGDGVTYGAPTTDTSDRSQAFQWEISGAGATWANSLEDFLLETVASGSTNTSTAKSPAASSSLMLVAGFDTFIVFPATSTISGGMTLDASLSAQFSIAGNAAHITGTTSSQALTINWAGSTPGAGTVAFATIILKLPASPGETGTGALHFSGLSYSGTGSVIHATAAGAVHFGGVAFNGVAARTETSTGALHFGGVSYTAAGSLIKVRGTGALHFAGISIRANALKLAPGGTGLRQFSTFG